MSDYQERCELSVKTYSFHSQTLCAHLEASASLHSASGSLHHLAESRLGSPNVPRKDNTLRDGAKE